MVLASGWRFALPLLLCVRRKRAAAHRVHRQRLRDQVSDCAHVRGGLDLSSLNGSQLNVVTAPDGHHLVSAGAGTGKTTTLVYRVAWLIDQGVAPHRILLVTFTKRAAQEMLERVYSLVGTAGGVINGGTFHAFAAKQLRFWGKELGYTSSFSILDTDDAQTLVKIILGEMELGERQGSFPRASKLQQMISQSANLDMPLEDVVKTYHKDYLSHMNDINRVAERYRERKKNADTMDYDDLIDNLSNLLTNNPRARESMSGYYKHILVDEYQDTNKKQALITTNLCSQHGNVMVVGDEAQSIYGFRGSTIKNIMGFRAAFPNSATTKLEDNYRSTQQVLDIANAALKLHEESYRKVLRSHSASGHRPQLVEAATEADEARFVAEEIEKRRARGESLNGMVVLHRSRQHANLVEAEIVKKRIPYRKVGGLRFNQYTHVKDVSVLLRVGVNLTDKLAWTRVLTWFHGIGNVTANKIMAEIIETRTLSPLVAEKWARKNYGDDLASLHELLTSIRALETNVSGMMSRVLSYYRPLMEKLHGDPSTRVADLESLGTMAQEAVNIDYFLDELCLDGSVSSGSSTGPDGSKGVLTISTIHSAKGLEWDTVFLIQLRDTKFPSTLALQSASDLEEERRVFYVAVTRAKRDLVLVRPATYDDNHPECQLLNFLEGSTDLVDRQATGRCFRR